MSIYMNYDAVQKLTLQQWIDNANKLIDRVNNAPQDKFYPTIETLISDYIAQGQTRQRNFGNQDKQYIEIADVLDRLYKAGNNYGKLSQTNKPRGGRTEKPPFIDSDPVNRKLQDDKPKGAGTGPDGDTYNVTTKAPFKSDAQKDAERRAEVKQAVDKAKDLEGTDLSAETDSDILDFLDNVTYDQLVKEIAEIDNAINLLSQADKDKVISIERARNQEAMLNRIKKLMVDSETYKSQDKKTEDERIKEDMKKRGFTQQPTTQPPIRLEDGDPAPLPPLRNPPEPIQPEPQPTPMGKVGDIPLSGSQLMSEAKTYIRQINKIPVFRLPPELLNIKEGLNKAITRIDAILKQNKEVADESDLKDAVMKARGFFNRSDFNLNRVPDRKEVAGRAIDQGLDDMKKIEEQNKLAEQAKTKLTDLRPDAKEGEEERIKKNFNKDVLELKTANDVLKSQVNIQREEIKILKETIEQKKQRENQQMLAGVAPVFRHYLNLDIDNVVQEHEEKYYSTVI